MHWIASSDTDTADNGFEKCLWVTGDALRAASARFFHAA